MISAALIERSKLVFPDGSIMEIVIWKVPEPVPGSAHLFKYRLFYGRNGNRIVGFDNERGKGGSLPPRRHLTRSPALTHFFPIFGRKLSKGDSSNERGFNPHPFGYGGSIR
jgi:hypothetical protein